MGKFQWLEFYLSENLYQKFIPNMLGYKNVIYAWVCIDTGEVSEVTQAYLKRFLGS